MGAALLPLSLALTAGSTIVQGVGQYEGSQAKAAAANYQAQVADNNAKITMQNKAWALAEGETQVANKGLENRVRVGALTAGIAAHGVDVNSGSAASVIEAQRTLGILDEDTMMSNTARKLYGFDVEASNERSQATSLRMQASDAKTAGLFDVAGTILGGAESAVGDYSRFRDYGGGAARGGTTVGMIP